MSEENNKSSLSIVADNPLFTEETVAEEAMPSTVTKSRQYRKALLVAGALALAGGAFAAGFFTTTQTEAVVPGSSLASTLVSGRDSTGRVTFDRLRVKSAIVYLVQNNEELRAHPAFTDPAIMTQAVGVYKLTGQALAGLPEDFLALMAEVAPEVPDWLVQAIMNAGAGRRLGAGEGDVVAKLSPPKQSIQPYKNLLQEIQTDRQLAASSLEFINQLYIFVATDVRNMEHTVDYQHPNTANDHFGIQLIGEDCYIAARETDEDADWINNSISGIIDVLKVQGEGFTISAYAGFAEAYNQMRVGLWETISTECQAKGATKYNFGGWSRGGALAAIASTALYREGLLKKDEVRLMTFGAPRVLYFWDALRVHKRFEQWRLVYKEDFVTSLPATWENVGHFGTLISKQGTFPLGLDEPFFLFAEPTFADHAGYFLDWLPTATWDESKGHQAI